MRPSDQASATIHRQQYERALTTLKLVYEVQIDSSEAIWFGSMLADWRFIAQGRSGWFVFDRNSAVAVPIDSDAEVDLPSVRLSTFVDDDGFVRIENRCNDVEQEFRLEAIRPAGVDEKALFSAGAEAWCSSASGDVAVLWYGYFAGNDTQFATFVLLVGPARSRPSSQPDRSSVNTVLVRRRGWSSYPRPARRLWV